MCGHSLLKSLLEFAAGDVTGITAVVFDTVLKDVTMCTMDIMNNTNIYAHMYHRSGTFGGH